MARGTFKPCPGCRGTKYRAPQDVCEDCQKALAIGRAHLEQAQIDGKKEPKKLFRLTSDWPTFHCIFDPYTQDELQQAFMSIARRTLRRSTKNVKPYNEAVIQLPKETPYRGYYSTYDEEAVVYEGTETVAHAIDRLDLAVRAALSMANDKGEESGKQFIQKIIEGKMTMEDITEATIEASKARRRKR